MQVCFTDFLQTEDLARATITKPKNNPRFRGARAWVVVPRQSEEQSIPKCDVRPGAPQVRLVASCS